MKRPPIRALLGLVAAVLAGLALLAAPPARAEDVGESGLRMLSLPAEPGAHWFWLSDILLHRTALFDADSGRLLGTITAGSVGVGFIVEPTFSRERREIYIAESYFSRGVRGERTDVVTVYDSTTLLPVAEIPIPPKRAEYFPDVAANALSDDGRFLAVFNVTPGQSLSIVDVVARRLTAEVSTPGCSLVYPTGPRRFFMLCADGAAMIVTLDDAGGQRSVERTQRFFDADKDPLTEDGVRRGGEWIFVSYEGMVRPIDLSGDAPRFGEVWSLLGDADRQESWRVGGGQRLAIHRATGRLYVLVHQGGRDTHKEAGTEIWVYDLAKRSRLQRIPVQNPLASLVRLQAGFGRDGLRNRLVALILDRLLPNTGVDGILVTQDDRPVLVARSMIPPALTVHDATTGEVVREVSEPGIATGFLTAP